MSAAKKTETKPGVHDIARTALKKLLSATGWTVPDTGNAFADRSYEGMQCYLTDVTFLPSQVHLNLRVEREGLRPYVYHMEERGPRKPRYGIHTEHQESEYRNEWALFGEGFAERINMKLVAIADHTRIERERAAKEKTRADSRAIAAAAAQQKLQTQLEAVGVNPKYAALVHDGMTVTLPGGMNFQLGTFIRDDYDGTSTASMRVTYTVDMNSNDMAQQNIVDLLRFLTVAGALEK